MGNHIDGLMFSITDPGSLCSIPLNLTFITALLYLIMFTAALYSTTSRLERIRILSRVFCSASFAPVNRGGSLHKKSAYTLHTTRNQLNSNLRLPYGIDEKLERVASTCVKSCMSHISCHTL